MVYLRPICLLRDGNGIRLTIKNDNPPIKTIKNQGLRCSLDNDDIANSKPAAVIGIPTKPFMGASKLNLASRNAPQARNIIVATIPIHPISPSLNNKIKNAGATPNETISANESNCLPKSLLERSNLANKPSITSQKADDNIIISASVYISLIVKSRDNAPVTKFAIVNNEGTHVLFMNYHSLLKPTLTFPSFIN